MQLPQTIERKGVRVLTTKQIAKEYGVKEQQISQNFKNNRTKFIEGKHYISLSGDELKEFKNHFEKIEVVNGRASHLYLWTEKGALLHAKSLNTDKAWEVYDYLVDFYFRVKEKQVETKPAPVSKPNMRTVVDIPENVRMQKAIQEIRKQLNALDVIMQEYNVYRCEESYIHLKSTLDILWISLGRKIVDLMDVKPNLIQKQY